MAYIQQEYTIGQDFNLFTQAQLSVYDNVWKWDKRSLSGFITENGAFIEPGEIANFSTQQAQVSGVWALDKDVPVKLCCIQSNQSNGQISVSFEQSCVWAPLADAQHPYANECTLTSTSQFSAYYGSTIYFTIALAEGTTITDIKFDAYGGSGNSYDSPVAVKSNTIFDTASEEFVPGNGSLLPNVKYRFYGNGKSSGNYKDAFLTISAYYASQGILEYVPNKDIYIPTPDNPAN